LTKLPINNTQNFYHQCCGAGGAVIKLSPGAGAAINIYGSGSGSLLFYQRLVENFRKKVMVAEESKNIYR
jgi:hypothetical protein